jgi:hypothetical protein
MSKADEIFQEFGIEKNDNKYVVKIEENWKYQQSQT